MRIVSVGLRRLRLPLVTPYRLSYRTFEEFEPFFVEIRSDNGVAGFADGHISPGSSAETREGGWAFSEALGRDLPGRTLDEARVVVAGRVQESKVAASIFGVALEMLAGSRILRVPKARKLPLLVPISAVHPEDVCEEVERLLKQGFNTFKIKVGKDLEEDLHRVSAIQEAVAGRATLRLDANRAFTREQGCEFASRLRPDGIDLFEQPCAAEDWEANAAVAGVSNVPLMLDEPICSLADIERAATIEGVRFCKLKLKRFGSLEGLRQGLELVRARGMEPVLGDGLGSDITGWLEACVAQETIRNAGEFNGFLKQTGHLLEPPLHFEAGVLEMPVGYRPSLNRSALDDHTVDSRTFFIH